MSDRCLASLPRCRASAGRAGLRAVAASLFCGIWFAPSAAEPPRQIQVKPAPPRPPGLLRVDSPVNTPGTVILRWTGTIAPPMADQMTAAFNAFKSTRHRVVLTLSSGGGSVAEGERVITLLRNIRRTHKLDTVVERGALCGSMCVPLYLQGENRYGARVSSWLFHEITQPGSDLGKRKKVEGRYMQLIDKYWIDAGVSRAWIDRMVGLAQDYDYWVTGEELITTNSGIITRPIENRSPRQLESSATAAPALSEPDRLPPPPPPVFSATPEQPQSVNEPRFTDPPPWRPPSIKGYEAR
jgi:ATP-dependent protease ClpP protease subunit